MAKERRPGKVRPVKPGVSWAAPLLTDSWILDPFMQGKPGIKEF